MILACPSCGQKNRVAVERVEQGPVCGACKAALAPIDRPLPMASVNDFYELINASPLPVLVDFWAAWCGPCRMVAPELEKLAKQRAGRVIIAKVDTEALQQVAAQYRIHSIPTLAMFRAGAEVKRAAGAMQAAAIAAEFGL